MTFTVTRRTVITGKPRTPGERVRMLRAEKDWTLRELECASNISNAFISQFERGLVGISLDHAVTLAKALGTTVEYIATGDGRYKVGER